MLQILAPCSRYCSANLTPGFKTQLLGSKLRASSIAGSARSHHFFPQLIIYRKRKSTFLRSLLPACVRTLQPVKQILSLELRSLSAINVHGSQRRPAPPPPGSSSARASGAPGRLVLPSAAVSPRRRRRGELFWQSERSPAGVKEGRSFFSSWAFAKSLLWAFLGGSRSSLASRRPPPPVFKSGEIGGRGWGSGGVRWHPERSASEELLPVGGVCVWVCVPAHVLALTLHLICQGQQHSRWEQHWLRSKTVKSGTDLLSPAYPWTSGSLYFNFLIY